ncbi:MAG: hypothetical protein JSU90_08395 [Nitrospiraceae bacterium]|nr:MAG: hypothetical protein JSU90_08395 [Nitrospiraceae bacterium]
MAERGCVAACLIVLLMMPVLSCADREGNQREAVFTKIPEIAEIRPERPVKIRLKRNAEGDYSWELNGDDAGKVMQADRMLREGIKR